MQQKTHFGDVDRKMGRRTLLGWGPKRSKVKIEASPGGTAKAPQTEERYPRPQDRPVRSILPTVVSSGPLKCSFKL